MDSRASALPHLDLLADAVGRFAAALDAAEAGGGLDRPVPALTRWTVADVGAHLAGVHRWCAALVRDGRRPRRGSVPAGRDGLAVTYRAEAAAMLDVLRDADPDQPCWTMDRTDRRAAFWPRRQLHEVVVHLWDVRSVDDPTPDALDDVPAEVASDGADELLQMAPTRLGSTRAPLPGPLALHATDTGARWLLGPDWLPADPGACLEAAASIEAPARALLLHVWGRGTPATSTGDEATLRAFARAAIRA
ncbi:maleylpyruvate isomerase N-terminal domain-containing protein [Aquipuribacter hungaricus]|uniref:Maleylpyruvate isomerase N-terminal domain-containing protein n=1 Tax=Aquipuribacter hungaricus TaxID=545624 RepID=A0ABV7WMM3_9MICO